MRKHPSGYSLRNKQSVVQDVSAGREAYIWSIYNGIASSAWLIDGRVKDFTCIDLTKKPLWFVKELYRCMRKQDFWSLDLIFTQHYENQPE